MEDNSLPPLITGGIVRAGDFTLEVGTFPYDTAVHIVEGANGSGKTTLLKALIGAVPLTKGMSFHPRTFGYIAQDPRSTLLGWGTIRKSLLWLMREADLDEFDAWSNFFNLPPNILNMRPHQLSGGEVQKLCLIRECMLPVDCLVLDEPFASLDSNSIEPACSLLHKTMSRHLMIVLTSHVVVPSNLFPGAAVRRVRTERTGEQRSKVAMIR